MGIDAFKVSLYLLLFKALLLCLSLLGDNPFSFNNCSCLLLGDSEFNALSLNCRVIRAYRTGECIEVKVAEIGSVDVIDAPNRVKDRSNLVESLLRTLGLLESALHNLLHFLVVFGVFENFLKGQTLLRFRSGCCLCLRLCRLHLRCGCRVFNSCRCCRGWLSSLLRSLLLSVDELLRNTQLRKALLLVGNTNGYTCCACSCFARGRCAGTCAISTLCEKLKIKPFEFLHKMPL